MAVDSGQQGHEICRILALTDEGSAKPDARYGSQIESQTCMDGPINCQKSADMEEPFSPPCFISVDMEKYAPDISKMNQKTGGTIKTEIALTKLLRRQNSLHTGGESLPLLMNHLLMLLKLHPKEKQAIQRAHDAATSRWRKYKRAASFDSRQIVLLFSILSSMGTLVLILMTLKS